jgi:hypothetical protein
MIAYLHGFNSSPQSHKARTLQRYLESRGLGARYRCPALPPLARVAVDLVEREMAAYGDEPTYFIGSSLGGFYATYLAEKHDARAVLINPAIDPHIGLRAYIGAQKNLHTGEPYVLTEEYLRDWEQLYCSKLTPGRYLVIVETGDEVLDYREALERYAGAEQIVIPGGDHSLQSFSQHLPRILRFCGLPS